MPVPDLPSFYIIIHTMPPLLSLTIFCMVSCSLDWLSSPMEVSLLRMPSCTSCSMDFPNIFVSQMLSPRCPLSPIYWIRSYPCSSVPPIGALSVSMLALIMWIEGLLDFIRTPYLLPCRMTDGSSIWISPSSGTTTP